MMKKPNKKVKDVRKVKEKSLAVTIVKDSIQILILSSILVTFAGVALKYIEGDLIVLIPILILLPAMNKMIGDFGIIIVSKFTTMIYEKKVKKPILHSHNLRHLFKDIYPIALISAIYVAVLATLVSSFKGFSFDMVFVFKIVGITLAITSILVFLHFIIAVVGGFYVYRKGKDPDDLLIPLTTSIADLGSTLLLVILVILLF